MERSVSYLKDDDPMFSPAPAREAPARRVFHALGTMLRGETGLPQADVENAVLRARRPQVAPPVPSSPQRLRAPGETARAARAPGGADPADPGLPGGQPALRRRRA